MGPTFNEASTGKILIVDDHQVVLSGTIGILREHYPTHELLTAKTAQEALEQLANHRLSLAILDLSIPEAYQQDAKVETGIELLRQVMKHYPEQNIAVQSTYIKALVRVRSEIDSHQGGFTIVDKSMSSQDIFQRIDGALKGFSHTRGIKALQAGIELKPEWLEVLTLAFHEGLQDKAIAQELNVQPSTIRHYWNKLYDVLEIDPEVDKKDGKNLRSLTEIRARERGLLD
ncbi:MAG: response regulator transcription factor [Cyanobacteria bacterium J06633_23]